MDDIVELANKLKNGEVTGSNLAEMVTNGTLSKGERRKVVKLANAKKAEDQLTDRQKLRLAVKEKKSLPKLTKDDRKRKYQSDLESEREKDSANFTICLGCRKRGHFLKDCPKALCVPVSNKTTEICFNCGSAEHTLKNCPEQRDSGRLKYATCFICKQVGHISRDCTQNANGLYVNGGCCHICLKKTHLVKDCPERTEEDKLAYLQKKQEKEDEELNGVRVKGLVAVSDPHARDESFFFEEGEEGRGDHSDSDEENSNRKKDKSNKKKHKKKSK